MSGRVTVSIDLPDLAGVLFESELEVLENFGDEALDLIGGQWVGWRYAGNYSEDQKGTSGAAWGYELADPTTNTRGISFVNEAEIKQRTDLKANGEPFANNQVGQMYAKHVRRSGATKNEWEVVFDRITAELLPGAVAELRDAILANAGRQRVIVDLEPRQLADVEVFVL